MMLGYGIYNDESLKFLQQECGIEIKNPETKTPHTPIEIGESLEIHAQKTVILTTSMKHARLLAKEFK